jgi:2-polyprenyl-3-methyl-5-hydroxy-6-metoxy-1,4-benzoquinol methylase
MARRRYDTLRDPSGGYPANDVALQRVLNVLQEQGARRLLEVSIGHGIAIPVLAAAGREVSCLEIKDELVEVSRVLLVECGRPAEAVAWGDIEDATTYRSVRRHADFDAILALGVLPHARQEQALLSNVRAVLKPGGTNVRRMKKRTLLAVHVQPIDGGLHP